MRTKNHLAAEEALRSALTYAGIENDENRCLLCRCVNGLFQIIVWTPYLKYEFYVDAENGEVLGIDMIPVPYPEALCLCSQRDDRSPLAA